MKNAAFDVITAAYIQSQEVLVHFCCKVSGALDQQMYTACWVGSIHVEDFFASTRPVNCLTCLANNDRFSATMANWKRDGIGPYRYQVQKATR